MKRHHQTTPPDSFRLIRAFSAEHNLRRLRRHVERLQRRPDMVRWRRLQKRFITRANKASAKRAA